MYWYNNQFCAYLTKTKFKFFIIFAEANFESGKVLVNIHSFGKKRDFAFYYEYFGQKSKQKNVSIKFNNEKYFLLFRFNYTCLNLCIKRDLKHWSRRLFRIIIPKVYLIKK